MLFDGRNRQAPQTMAVLGFDYQGIGRGPVQRISPALPVPAKAPTEHALAEAVGLARMAPREPAWRDVRLGAALTGA